MSTPWIWVGAAFVYAAFWAWYQGFRGPLAKAEVEAYLARLSPGLAVDPDRRDRMRAFLEADDGKEFFMVNLIRLHPDPVRPPDGGAPAPAARVLERYTGPFLRALFRRGGHPALGGPAAAGYLEAWGVEKNPGWTMAGIIRYRSRRDLIALASAPEFAPIHAFKSAGISNTLAFPVARARLFFSPRVVAALGIALAAALASLAFGG
jgi:hypothetical protein